jgi:hypothetical protein
MRAKSKMITGSIKTPAGDIPRVATILNKFDIRGAVKVRWSIGRNTFTVDPGLYGVGNPEKESDVFVTANFKLSFDHLRKNLDGLNAWILVLDTKGINVWCAAGKGTFGTQELVHRIQETRLSEIISHRKIIVPQLGAPGVSAHQVKALTSAASENHSVQTSAQSPKSNITQGFTAPVFSGDLKIERGFRIVFGPIRATDIKVFIDNKYKTSDEMRMVHFPLNERLKLLPVDIVYGKYRLLLAMAIFFILPFFNSAGFNLEQGFDKGLPAILFLGIAYLTGILITPILLPWIPVKMFGFKGLICGLAASLILFITGAIGSGYLHTISWFLIISAISSFMAMNFTGSSTYTSLSGVKREMKIFVPIQISFAGIGLILYIISNFVSI